MAPLEVDGAHQATSGAGANTKAGSLAGFDSLEQLLKEHVPADKLEEALRVLHGTKGGHPVSDLTIPKDALSLAAKLAFDLQAYRFSAAVEQLRSPRVVRVGIIQNAIVLETTAPYAEQRQAIFNRVKGMIEAAGAAGVRILCLQV
jgi:beta-ureidopropionase